jgi:hypothetical protein
MKSKCRLPGFAVVIAAIVFCFSACGSGGGGGGGGGGGSGGSGGDSDFIVRIDPELKNGTITANPAKGPAGTEVKLTITANVGYMYKTESLRFKDETDTPISDTGATAFSFPLTKNVTITADFVTRPANVFSVTVIKPANGTITAWPIDAKAGDTINLNISPAPGYILDTLAYTPDGGASQTITVYTFTMPAKNVTVTGSFKKGTSAADFIAAGINALNAYNYDVAVSCFDSAYSLDKNNQEAIVYSTLGRLAAIAVDPKVKALMSERIGIKNYPGTINSLVSPDWMEIYTDEELVRDYYNGTDWAYWYGKNDWAFRSYGLTQEGYYKTRYLNPKPMTRGDTVRRQGKLDGYYDEDLDTYLVWYNFDPGNYPSGTAGYYYLDYETYTWLFATSTPKTGDLNSYFDDNERWYEWYDTDPGSGYTGFIGTGYYWVQEFAFDLVSTTPQYGGSISSRLPGLNAPSWLNSSTNYRNSFTSKNLQSSSTFAMLLFANLLEKNTNGLNTLLDQLLSAVFGDALEEAYTRAGTLTGDVKLKESTLKAFGIDEIYEGEEVYIGKAELKVLFAALRIVKASLEWVSAYDWNTEMNFLKNGSLWDDWTKLNVNKPASLPFRNNFLKDRNNGMMVKSKADFIKAIEDAIAAYDLWIGSGSKLPQGYKDTLNEYKWARDGFSQLKTAINNGQAFYVKLEGSGNTYSNTAEDALYGIDLGKFFTPGYLSLDKLIETTGSGATTAPVFYGCQSGYSGGVKITAVTQIKNYQRIGLKFNTAPGSSLKQVLLLFPSELEEEAQYLKMLPPEIAEAVYGWYYN